MAYSKHVQLIKHLFNVSTCNHGAQKVIIKAWKSQSPPRGPLRGREAVATPVCKTRPRVVFLYWWSRLFYCPKRLLRRKICENTCYKTDTIIQLPFWKKPMLAFTKNAFNWSKVTVKTFIMSHKCIFQTNAVRLNFQLIRFLKNSLSWIYKAVGYNFLLYIE